MSRVVSPAGFLLALLLFVFLPFVAVSCEDGDGFGSAEVSYRGLDLVTAADQEIRTTGTEGFQVLVEQETEGTSTGALPDVRLVAIVAGALMLLGAVVSALAGRTATAWLAVLAAAAVVAVHQLATANLDTALRDAAVESRYTVNSAQLDQLSEQTIETRLGFWATLGALALVLAFTVVSALRARRLTST